MLNLKCNLMSIGNHARQTDPVTVFVSFLAHCDVIVQFLKVPGHRFHRIGIMDRRRMPRMNTCVNWTARFELGTITELSCRKCCKCYGGQGERPVRPLRLSVLLVTKE